MHCGRPHLQRSSPSREIGTADARAPHDDVFMSVFPRKVRPNYAHTVQVSISSTLQALFLLTIDESVDSTTWYRMPRGGTTTWLSTLCHNTGRNTPILSSKTGFNCFLHTNTNPDFHLLWLLTIGTWEAETFCALRCYIDLYSQKVPVQVQPHTRLSTIFELLISICPNEQCDCASTGHAGRGIICALPNTGKRD